MAHNRVFTTGQAAKLCRISQQTLIRCFDQGTLKGYRVPGSSHRRITEAELRKFMLENGIPTDLLDPLSWPVLVATEDPAQYAAVTTVFKPPRFNVLGQAASSFAFAMSISELRLGVIVLSVRSRPTDLHECLDRIHTKLPEQVIVVAIADVPGLPELSKQLSKDQRIDYVIPEAFDPEALLEWVEQRIEQLAA